MLKELLMSSNYWVLNKNLVKQLGLETAFLLINLIEADKILNSDNGYFFQTSEKLEEITGLKRSKQTKAINKLLDQCVVEQKNMGIPCKRYFKISYSRLEQLINESIDNTKSFQFVEKQQTSMMKNNKLDCSKTTNIYKENNINKININNNQKDIEEEETVDDIVNVISETYKVNFFKIEKWFQLNGKENCINWIKTKSKEIPNPNYISKVINAIGKISVNNSSVNSDQLNSIYKFYNLENNKSNEKQLLLCFINENYNDLINLKLRSKSDNNIYLYSDDKKEANFKAQYIKSLVTHYSNDKQFIRKMISSNFDLDVLEKI